MRRTFRNINGWYDLPATARAEIILVLADVKPAAITGGLAKLHTTFMDTFKKLGVYWWREPEAKTTVVYHISKKRGPIQKFLRSRQDYHLRAGKYLGYPACCTREYLKPSGVTIPQNPRQQKEFFKMFLPRFDRELLAILKRVKVYRGPWNWHIPSTFKPCSAYCPNAIRLAKHTRLLLLKHDARTASDILKRNRNIQRLLLKGHVRYRPYGTAA